MGSQHPPSTSADISRAKAEWDEYEQRSMQAAQSTSSTQPPQSRPIIQNRRTRIAQSAAPQSPPSNQHEHVHRDSDVHDSHDDPIDLSNVKKIIHPPEFYYSESDPIHAKEIRRLPPGWDKYVHFNGKLYFHNTRLQLVTPNDIREDSILREVLRIHEEQLAAWKRINGSDMPKAWEHAVSLPPLDSKATSDVYHFTSKIETGCYYLHNNEFKKVDGAQHWRHLEMYPMHFDGFSNTLDVIFLNALTFGANERILDNRNTHFPFDGRQCERFLKIYQDLKDRQSEPGFAQGTNPALNWHIARIMVEIEESRARYRWGTEDYRLYRNIAIPEPTTLEMILTLPLFGAHSMYRKRLHSTRVKGSVYLPDFQKLMKEFLDEWADSNLLATVFASANVAFLAVPGINSLQRTASLASSLFAMMSIATGVHHVWRHRSKTDAEFKEADSYLHHVQKLGEHVDLTITACFLSLPIVALLWSVLSFTIGVAAFCIQGSDRIGEILLIVLLGLLGFGVCVMILFFWHIWRSPRTKEIEEEFIRDSRDYVHPLTRWQKVQKFVHGWLQHAKKLSLYRKGILGGESSRRV